MAMKPFEFYGRPQETRQLDAFFDDDGPGFTHLRGRRRIGKTELLKRVREGRTNCFFFMGREDESNRECMKRFAASWDRFTGQRRLTRLKISELNWDEFFTEVGTYAAVERDGSPFILLLDEVQWLAKKGVGFCGLIKDHWAEWKRPGRFKIILSGSSNRFFHQYTDGEQAVLRGLRTHATIWVQPFTPAEVKRHYFPAWTDEEICLVYMMLGGVPYYLENLRADANFIRTVNRSLFCRQTLFLEEVDAMLRIETPRGETRKRVKDVLASLGQDGATEATIVQRTGLAQDTVHRILGRLLDFDVIRERRPLGQRKKNRSGVRFYMDDFYLNFNFQVLEPMAARIRGNDRGLLFPVEVLGSGRGYYIPNFTGKAFELLLSSLLARGCDDESSRVQPLFTKLALESGRYRWGTYWAHGKTQIDLVIEGIDDREVRIIEAKWISKSADVSSTHLDEVRNKSHPPSTRDGWRRTHHLATSRPGSAGFRRRAEELGIGIIELADLFESI